IERVRPNPMQPRTEMDSDKLEELAVSIRQQGIVQPIVVRKMGYDYELIAGERRLQAARRAGLNEIPAVIRDVPDAQLLELALIENIQREELNPIDEARAYARLLEAMGVTQQALAARVGKDRATISNALRLLNLPEGIQRMIASGALSPGHARAILATAGTASEMIALATRIAEQGLTVRDIEELAKAGRPARHKGRRTKRRPVPEL